MASDFQYIPIIDLSLAESPETRPELLKQLHYALTQVGFLYVSNHGVPSETVQDLKKLLPRLFELDQEVKEKAALHNSPHFLGYSHVGAETTAGIEDKREQFEFATELLDLWRDGCPLYKRLKGPNQVCHVTFHPSQGTNIHAVASGGSTDPEGC
jgi:isopenicillin N synthase-like dioxygenase